MNTTRKRSWMLVPIILASTLIGAWALVDRHEQRAVDGITGNMQTICVGRFLIDLPEKAQIELRQVRIDGFDIAAFDETKEEFHKRVADREAQLKAKPDWRGGDKNLESARDVQTGSGLIGKIFMHSRTVDEGTQSDGLGGVERYRYEGMSTEALVHARGISIDLSSENRALKWKEDLPRLVKQLVANPDNRIPTESGFCMDRAYVRDPLRPDQLEQIIMFAKLPNYPDIEFLLIVAAGLHPESQGLLERNKASNAHMLMAEMGHVSTLRGASRTIGGIAGDELVERVIEDNSATVYSFWWEVNGTEDNVFIPHLSLTMDTGKGNHGPIPSSLSEDVALRLWDKISSSIRVRPSVAANAIPTQARLIPASASSPDRAPPPR